MFNYIIWTIGWSKIKWKWKTLTNSWAFLFSQEIYHEKINSIKGNCIQDRPNTENQNIILSSHYIFVFVAKQKIYYLYGWIVVHLGFFPEKYQMSWYFSHTAIFPREHHCNSKEKYLCWFQTKYSLYLILLYFSKFSHYFFI